MATTIEQEVEFENVTPQDLFDTYLDSQKHGAAIGATAAIQREVGGEFRAFGDNGLKGRILELVPGRRIVQSWRGQPWTANDLDSIVVLTFHETPKGARIDLVHANIPEHAQQMVNEKAWDDRYWQPWRAYLKQRATAA